MSLSRCRLLNQLNPLHPVTPPNRRRMEFEHQIASGVRSGVANSVGSPCRMQHERIRAEGPIERFYKTT